MQYPVAILHTVLRFQQKYTRHTGQPAVCRVFYLFLVFQNAASGTMFSMPKVTPELNRIISV